MSKKPLGEILIELGKINREQLYQALEHQKKDPKKLGRILQNLGWITIDDIFMALARQHNYPFIELEKYELDQELISLVPKELAWQYQIVPFGYSEPENRVSLAIAPPFDFQKVGGLSEELGLQVKFALAAPNQIEKKLKKHY